MNNSIKKLFLLSLSLLFITTIIILIMGRTYTLSFTNVDNFHNLVIDDGANKIKVLERRQVGDKYLVKIKALKPGKVYFSMNYNDYYEDKLLYIHKTKVITDNNFFGYSRGSEAIPISLSIILIYTLYLLIKRYRKCMMENIYQYKNVAYLGIIIFIMGFLLNNLISIINYRGLFDTVSKTISSMSFVSYVLFPIALITFILVTISNIKLLRREGKSLKNILGLFMGIVICILTLLPEYTYRFLMKSQIINIYNLNGPGPYIYNFCESFVYLIVAYLECVLIGTIIVSLKATKKKLNYDKDYMIILGCKIREDGSLTPLLKGRVDKAIEFRNCQYKTTGKDLIFITSGGKGSDEVMPEAEAMKNYLLKQGINKKNIIVEDKATNTYENIKYSNALIKKKKTNIAFSTTNYHVFRTGLLATTQGLKIEGIGSKTKSYFWINAFIREFIGTLYAERGKHRLVLLIILIIIILMISITFMANNI